jgi:hypothetical protein
MKVGRLSKQTFFVDYDLEQLHKIRLIVTYIYFYGFGELTFISWLAIQP